MVDFFYEKPRKPLTLVDGWSYFLNHLFFDQ